MLQKTAGQDKFGKNKILEKTEYLGNREPKVFKVKFEQCSVEISQAVNPQYLISLGSQVPVANPWWCVCTLTEGSGFKYLQRNPKNIPS